MPSLRPSRARRATHVIDAHLRISPVRCLLGALLLSVLPMMATQIAHAGDGVTNTRTWDGGGGDNLWSTAANWSSDTVPDSDDIAYFGATSSANATVNSSFAGMLQDLKVAPGYGGKITLQRNLTLSGGTLTLSGGTFTFGNAGRTLTVGQDLVTYPKATFVAGTGTIVLTGTSTSRILTSTGAFNNLTINSGLSAYWKLDGSSTTTAKDSSGNGNLGTSSGGPQVSTSVPTTRFYDARSWSFDGGDDYIDGGNPSIGNGRLSISVWINPSTVSQNGGIVSKWTTGVGTNDAFTLYIGQNTSTNKLAWAVEQSNGTIQTLNSTTSLSSSTWYHVVAVADGSYLRLYVNGASAGTPVAYDGTVRTTTSNLTIGRLRPTDTLYQFAGKIDDVRLYSRGLASTEVTSLYRGYPSTGSGTYTIGSALDVNGNLNLVSGTLDVSGSNYSVNLAGNLQNVADFTKRSGTFTLDGSATQTLSGTTVFNNLSKVVTSARSLFLDYTGRQSASGSLTLTGAASNLLTIRSTRSGSGAKLVLDGDSGTQSLSYVDVKDIDASGGATLSCSNCTDSGNNTNISIVSPGTTTTLTSNSNPSTLGSSVTLTATVSPSAATGNVTFKDGSTTIGTATLGHGSGKLLISTLGAGSHSLTAVYAGDGTYDPGTSNTLTQVVSSITAIDKFLGYWKFDETSGSVAADSSGDGNTGTRTNSPTVSTDVPTTSFTNARSISFDGTNDYVDVGTTTSFINTSQAFTYSLWINPSQFSSSVTNAISNLKTNGSNGWLMLLYDANGYRDLSFGVASAKTISFPSSIPNHWWHVAIVYNGGGIDTAGSYTAYINGSSVSITSGSAYVGQDNRTTLGSSFESGAASRFFAGKLDEIRIYSRALSAGEIADLAAGRHTTATWTGTSSTSYETAGNWNTAAIPDPYTRIVVPNTANKPTLLSHFSGAALSIQGGTLDLASYNFTLNDGGPFTNSGTLALAGNNSLANLTNDRSHAGTVRYNGTTTYSSLPLGNAYYNLTFSGTGATWQPSSNLGVSGALVISAGTLDTNGQNIVVDGATTASGGTFLAKSGTHLHKNGLTVSGGTYRGSTGNVDVNASITLRSGTMVAPRGTFTVSGDWIKKSSATFTASGGTVTLDGTNQTLSGSTAFYGLTKTGSAADTLTFERGSTQTLTGPLTLQGAANNLLSLRSSLTGTQWNIDPQGSRTVDYLDVKDSNNANASVISGAGHSLVNGGNNTNWNGLISQNSTTTTLTSSSNPSSYGDSITLTATVSPGAATGNVTFKDGSTTIGTATLGHGSGKLLISTLGAGSHSLTAEYSGDLDYSGSTSNTVSQTVNQAATTTTLASSTNPSSFGTSITLTGTVSSAAATGSLTFKDGGTTIGTASLGHGSGVLAIATLGAGSHSLTVVYSGNVHYSTSTSNTVSQTVNQASTTTTLASSSNPSTYGDTVRLTATVSPSSATGSLTFKDGSTTIGTATLGHGSGSMTTSSLSIGSHSLTVVYAGNGSAQGSTSNTVTQVVNQVTVYQIISTGQSNAVGYGASPALTTTQPYNNKKVSGGSLIPLVEPSGSLSGVETMGSAMANTITANVTNNAFKAVVTNNAVSTTSYSQIKKGTATYSGALTEVQTVKTFATATGALHRIAGITAIHGETDEHNGRSAAEYESYLVQWQSDYETDTKAISGQSQSVPLFIDQLSSFFTTYGNDATAADIPMGQLAAAEDNPGKIVLVAPRYFFTYVDLHHLDNVSQRWLGEYYGKVIKKVIVDGESWRPLSPDSVTRTANIIYAQFHVPSGVLAFDTTLVSARANYGFEYYDSTSSASISSVEIISDDTVKVTLNTTPTGSNQRLRYAYTGTLGANAGAQVSGAARGNLRDTDSYPSLYGNTLYNWSVHFDKAIAAADTTSPSVSSLSPSDNATDVSVTTNLALTFDEAARAGTGTLSIKRTADNSTVETITVSGALLAGNGTTTLTFNPVTTLSGSTSYYVTWTANAFKDAAGNHVAAQSSSTYWNFTTIDSTAPAAPGTPDLQAASDTGTSSTDNVTSDTTPTFDISCETSATVQVLSGATVLASGTCSAGSITLTSSNLGSQNYSVTARQTDAANNASDTSSPLVLTIDASTPTAPGTPDLSAGSDSGTSSTDNVTSSSTPDFTVSCEDGTAVTLQSGSTVLGSGTCSSGTVTITSSTLSSGHSLLKAKQTDAAGNVSSFSSTLDVTVDASAPSAPGTPDLSASSDTGTSSTDDVTNNATPDFTIASCENNATVTLQSGSTVLGTGTCASNTVTITSSTLSTGISVVKAKQTDAAGNVSSYSSTLSVTIDTSGPSAPGSPDLQAGSDTGTSSTDNITSDSTPDITLTCEVGTSVTFQSGSSVLASTACLSSPLTFTPTLTTDQTYGFKAKQTDAAGNVSSFSSTLSVTLDTTVPTPGTPDLSDASDTGTSSTDNITNDTTPDISVSCEVGVSVQFYSGSSLIASTACLTSPLTFTPTLTTDQVYGFNAKQTDTAGNVSSFSTLDVTLDATAPSAPGTPDLSSASDSGTSSTDNVTSSSTPDFTVSCENGTAVTLQSGSTVLGSGTCSSGTVTITSSTLSSGHSLPKAKQTDAAGNVSSFSSTLDVTVDASAPSAPGTPALSAASDTGTSSSDNITSDSTPDITVTCEVGTSVTFQSGSSVLASTACLSSPLTFTPTLTTDQTYGFKAKQTDAAGNVSSFSPALSLTLDTAASSLAEVTPIPTPTNDETPNYTFSSTEAGTIAYGGDCSSPTTTASIGTNTVTFSSVASGTHSNCTVTVTDVAGNASTALTVTTFVIDTTAPSVSSLSPADDATAVGLAANLVVTFGDAGRAGTGTLSIKRTADNSNIETITVSGALLSGNGTTTLTFNPVTTLSGSTSYYVTWTANAFKDAAGNHVAARTAATAWNFTTESSGVVSISGVAASSKSGGADITWMTNPSASSRVQFGPTAAYGSSTAVSDTSPRVTSHAVSLSGLLSCSTFHYRVLSTDANGISGTGSDATFTSLGCTGGAAVEAETGSLIARTATGTLNLSGTETGIVLTIPPLYNTGSVTFQIKKLRTSSVLSTASTPTDQQLGSSIYNLKALSGSTTSITVFLQPITVMIRYSDAAASSLLESTLWIYRWDGSTWSALDACVVDVSANTVTCTTTRFSDFALFGTARGPAGQSNATGQSTFFTSGGTRPETIQRKVDSVVNSALRLIESTSPVVSPGEPKDSEPFFDDVPAGAWFASAVSRLMSRGIVSGYADEQGKPLHRFGPSDAVSYAQILKMGLLGADRMKSAEHRSAQNQSSRGQWSEPYVAAAEALGLPVLTPRLPVNNSARRAEVVAMLNAMFGIPAAEAGTSTGYADLPSNAPFASAILAATHLGLVRGDTDLSGRPVGRFRPNSPINRAEAAALLIRYIDAVAAKGAVR